MVRRTLTSRSGCRTARTRSLANGLTDVKRIGWEKARSADTTKNYDFLETYVDDLPNVVNLDAVRDAGIRIGRTRLVVQASTTGGDS